MHANHADRIVKPKLCLRGGLSLWVVLYSVLKSNVDLNLATVCGFIEEARTFLLGETCYSVAFTLKTFQTKWNHQQKTRLCGIIIMIDGNRSDEDA